MPAFNQQLKIGKVGESQISQWLRGRGFNVLPVYEIEMNQGKGPALYSADGGEIIAPDILAFKGDKFFWIEAKHKTAFSWHRKTKRFVTGIDQRHYEEYKKINMLVNFPVWLLFLHQGGQAKDSPPSPAGLFGNDLCFLSNEDNINHRHDGWGKSGMVYWAIESLKKLSEYPLSLAGAA